MSGLPSLRRALNALQTANRDVVSHISRLQNTNAAARESNVRILDDVCDGLTAILSRVHNDKQHTPASEVQRLLGDLQAALATDIVHSATSLDPSLRDGFDDLGSEDSSVGRGGTRRFSRSVNSSITDPLAVELASVQIECDEIARENAELVYQVADLTAECTEYEQLAAKQTELIDELREKVLSLEEAVESLEDMLEAAESRADEALRQLYAGEGVIHSLERKLAQSDALVAELRAVIEDQRADLHAALTVNIESELSNSGARGSILQSRVSTPSRKSAKSVRGKGVSTPRGSAGKKRGAKKTPSSKAKQRNAPAGRSSNNNNNNNNNNSNKNSNKYNNNSRNSQSARKPPLARVSWTPSPGRSKSGRKKKKKGGNSSVQSAGKGINRATPPPAPLSGRSGVRSGGSTPDRSVRARKGVRGGSSLSDFAAATSSLSRLRDQALDTRPHNGNGWTSSEDEHSASVGSRRNGLRGAHYSESGSGGGYVGGYASDTRHAGVGGASPAAVLRDVQTIDSEIAELEEQLEAATLAAVLRRSRSHSRGPRQRSHSDSADSYVWGSPQPRVGRQQSLSVSAVRASPYTYAYASGSEGPPSPLESHSLFEDDD